MPGIRSPSDYSQEPQRHPALKINAKASYPFDFFPKDIAQIINTKSESKALGIWTDGVWLLSSMVNWLSNKKICVSIVFINLRRIIVGYMSDD